MDKINDEIVNALSGLDIASRQSLLRFLKSSHFRDTVLKCWDIYDRKGNDYTRGKGDIDRLDNFREAAAGAGISILQSWYVYAYKHWSAVIRFVREGRVESEPIESRLYDVINYVVLLLLHVKEMREENHRQDVPAVAVASAVSTVPITVEYEAGTSPKKLSDTFCAPWNRGDK
jgi:hypothetical protein